MKFYSNNIVINFISCQKRSSHVKNDVPVQGQIQVGLDMCFVFYCSLHSWDWLPLVYPLQNHLYPCKTLSSRRYEATLIRGPFPEVIFVS